MFRDNLTSLWLKGHSTTIMLKKVKAVCVEEKNSVSGKKMNPHQCKSTEVWLLGQRMSWWCHFKTNLARGLFLPGTQVVTGQKVYHQEQKLMCDFQSWRLKERHYPWHRSGKWRGPAEESSENTHKHLHKEVSLKTCARAEKQEADLWQQWSCEEHECSRHFYIQPPPTPSGKNRQGISPPLLATGCGWGRNWTFTWISSEFFNIT